MWQQISPAFRIMAVFTVLLGFVYPGLITAICQIVLPSQANGSLIHNNGRIVGSELLGQNFARPEYLHPRPSAAGSDGYDASNSSGSNLGPTNKKLIDRVTADAAKFRQQNPSFTGPIPADALTTSASGLDPEISPENALAQTARIAQARGIDVSKVQQLIASQISQRQLGFIGEPRVNVLAANLALDRAFPRK